MLALTSGVVCFLLHRADVYWFFSATVIQSSNFIPDWDVLAKFSEQHDWRVNTFKHCKYPT